MNTKYFLRNAVLAAMLALPLILAGCRYDLVEGPSMDMNEEKNAADYKDFILPPASLTATQGESKAVVLTWPAVKNAVQYQVFAAESPFSTFSKVSETTSTETEIIIEEEAGITKYYCISAVNYYGTVSSKSVVAMGSTLAVPIITAIDASEEGNSVTVSWWMDNCSSDTYAADVSFNVNVYALSAPNIKFKSLTVDGDTRQVEIDGLTSKTEYYFEVEVVKGDSTSRECSEKTSAETAHRVIPDAPTNVTVSQGETTSDITISWQLPEGAWYRENSGVSGFVLHPIYFKIYRKLASQSDDKYEVIATAFVAANNSWQNRKDAIIPETGLAYPITSTDSDKKLAAPYESYVPGAEVSFVDSTAVRGNKYNYYIQSITDDTPKGKSITSESSKTGVVDGWLISEPRFTVKSTQVKDEETNLFTKISFAYEVSFETFGTDYTYFIEQTKYEFADSEKTNGTSEFLEPKNSLSELNAYKKEFNDPSGEEGYYKYTLYVCPKGSSDSSNAYINISAAGYYIVTADASQVPEISTFVLVDGYKDHFELSWDYNKDYTYTINWTDFKDGAEQTGSYEIPDNSACFTGKNTGDTVTYNHEANSGDRRIYNIVASTGLQSSPKYPGNDTDTIYETLGTVQPEITSYEYDKICVKWPAVQKAKPGIEDFLVSAKYQGSSSELVTDSNIQITNIGTENEPVYECVISKPNGYNDADWSGKKINLTVTAQSSSQTDTTTSTALNVYTIGPAATEVAIDTVLQSGSIGLKWKPVEAGVDGYLIRRIAYKTATYTDANLKDKEDVSSDIYYYNLATGLLSINGETVSPDRASVILSGGYLRLTDSYKEASSSENPYEVNQSYIAWGIPFGYTVIPVKKGGSSNDDFIFSGKTVKIKDEAEGYSNIKKYEYFGSASGYGLKVFAEKAESTETQVIRWNEPYKVDSSKSVSVYYRKAGNTDNKWTKIRYEKGEVSGGQQSALIEPVEKTEAYEYLVAYDKAASELTSVPYSFINDINLGLTATDETVYDYTGVTVEKANKGYLFAVNYFADTGSGSLNQFYSEVANWDEWDYSKRSIGPTSAVVRIVNNNISSDAIPLAELDNQLHFKKSSYPENTVVQQGNDAVSIKLWPQTMMDGTTNNPVTKGPLQVLRDAKHYYSIELIRGEKSVILDNSVYAYRNISEKELVKSALLTMAYGFYLDAGGERSLSNVNDKLSYNENKTITDGNGSAVFGGRSLLGITEAGKYKADVSMTDFSPLQLTPAGKDTATVAVTMSKVSTRTLGLSNRYLDKFRSEGFTVNVHGVDQNMPSSYSADLTMSCTGKSNLIIQIGSNSIVDTNSTDIRRVYFPIQMDESHYWLKDSNYGWWPAN